MTAEEFEASLEAIPVALAAPDPAPTDRMTSAAAEALILRPQVARALIEGASIASLSETLGVGQGTLRRYLKSAPMADLIEVESLRVLRHLSRRDLSKEKYLGLATAVGVFIDKARLLRNEPTDIHATINQTTIRHIEEGLFGRRNGTQGPVHSADSAADDGHAEESLLQDAEPSGEEGTE